MLLYLLMYRSRNWEVNKNNQFLEIFAFCLSFASGGHFLQAAFTRQKNILRISDGGG